MPYITCALCSSVFYAKPNRIQRGQAKYCSQTCSNIARTKPTLSLQCAQCKLEFQRKKISDSKSGLFFCSRKCKDTAQRIGGIAAIMPPHYGTGNGVHSYRERAFAHYGTSCALCGFSDIRAIEVHHLDKNRENNEIANLQVLCANCHCIAHM